MTNTSISFNVEPGPLSNVPVTLVCTVEEGSRLFDAASVTRQYKRTLSDRELQELFRSLRESARACRQRAAGPAAAAKSALSQDADSA